MGPPPHRGGPIGVRPRGLSAPARPKAAAGRCRAPSCTSRAPACRSPGTGRAARRPNSRPPSPPASSRPATSSGPITYGASASCAEPEPRSCSAVGRDGAVLVERGGHHRHREARGEQHAGDPGGLDGLLAADRGEDDAVRRGRDGEQTRPVGAGEPGLRQAHVQRLGEQRVRAEHIGQLGRGTAADDRLPYPVHQRAVGAREQRLDDRHGALLRRGRCGLTDLGGGGTRTLDAGGTLGGRVREHGAERGELGEGRDGGVLLTVDGNRYGRPGRAARSGRCSRLPRRGRAWWCWGRPARRGRVRARPQEPRRAPDGGAGPADGGAAFVRAGRMRAQWGSSCARMLLARAAALFGEGAGERYKSVFV